MNGCKRIRHLQMKKHNLSPFQTFLIYYWQERLAGRAQLQNWEQRFINSLPLPIAPPRNLLRRLWFVPEWRAYWAKILLVG